MFTLINETNLREDDEDTLAIQFQQNLQKLKAQRLGLKHDLAKVILLYTGTHLFN